MILLEGLVSFSEQHRLILQMSKLSDAELVSKSNDPGLHPGVRSVADHILDVRARAHAEADHHAGEQ
jgi:hypothetical protein